jgi:isochorismate synthase
MNSLDFLVYKLTNGSTQILTGSWQLITDSNPSGFIVSDAHGERFWQFEEKAAVSIDDLELPNFSDKQIEAISESAYLKNCTALVDEMKEKHIDKVVFSRIKQRNWSNEEFKKVFFELLAAYPNNLNYAFYSQELGFWMGSTPEILVKSQGECYTSMALAGTLASAESDELWTQKERDEQQYVSDYLAELINKYGQIEKQSERYVHVVGPVKHLRNDFEFSMANDHLWQFIRDFHPTPAVCGVPKNAARQLYQKYETHHRELYTGIIGWAEPGNMHLFVNLRCMQIHQNAAALYVGGGLTQDSDPAKEWLETERKSEALGRFLG